jgi:hypothetical protein
VIDLRTWSFTNILVASVLWVVLIVGLAAACIFLYFYLQFRSQSQSTGSAGIGAVSFGISAAALPAAFLVLFGPPIVLALFWHHLRRS